MFARLPIYLERFVAIPAGAILAVIAIHSAWTNVRAQREWKRTPGIVTNAADPRSTEVSLGAIESPERIHVPTNPGNIYGDWTHVTVLENPANPAERRILHWTSIADYWRKPLRCLVGIAGLALGVALLRRANDRYPLTWKQGAWRAWDTGSPSAPFVTVRHPSSAWKAHWFWGLVFGLPMSLAIFSSEEDVGGVLFGVAGLILTGVIAWSAIETKTLAIVADADGILLRSTWRNRRAPWAEIGELRRVDVVKQLNQRMKTRSRRSAVGGIGMSYQWRVYSREGAEIPLTIPDECDPPHALTRLLDYARDKHGVVLNRSGEPVR